MLKTSKIQIPKMVLSRTQKNRIQKIPQRILPNPQRQTKTILKTMEKKPPRRKRKMETIQHRIPKKKEGE